MSRVQLILYPSLIPDINRVIDHVTFLHIGLAVQWHTWNNKIGFTTEDA